MGVFKNLKIGLSYNKIQISELIGEAKMAKYQSGIYYCDTRDTAILFVTLDKTGKKKDLHYNDYFDGEYFEWDSQNSQSLKSPRIQKILTRETDVHLMIRIQDKIKGQTQPFTYCGELSYFEFDELTNNPIHITFQALNFDGNTKNTELKKIYNWKPAQIGGSSSFRKNYNKPVSEERKKDYKKPNKTERNGIVLSRVGQGYYREQLLKKWNYKCAVTGSSLTNILIASHIVPWKNATDEERLNANNGILLSPNYDALFDKGLITFNDDGSIVFSDIISSKELIALGIDKNASIKVNEEMKPFLKKHRNSLS